MRKLQLIGNENQKALLELWANEIIKTLEQLPGVTVTLKDPYRVTFQNGKVAQYRINMRVTKTGRKVTYNQLNQIVNRLRVGSGLPRAIFDKV